MHEYKIPLKQMTKEEKWEILHELLEKKKANIQKQREIIKKIEEELHKKKEKIAHEEEKLKHYRHLLNKIL
jgi:soluble cytochrome b562